MLRTGFRNGVVVLEHVVKWLLSFLFKKNLARNSWGWYQVEVVVTTSIPNLAKLTTPYLRIVTSLLCKVSKYSQESKS